MDYEAAYRQVIADPRYQQNLDWGKPRSGHPEGTVRSHIAEIEQNLERFKTRLSETDYWKLKLLIHTHDSFKAEAAKGVSIEDPKSHASLARAFLEEFCDDADLLAMCQWHDEPYALWKKQKFGKNGDVRFGLLLSHIKDWNLFLAFNIIDGCTAGKGRETLRWLFAEVDGKVESSFTASDIIE